MRWTRLSCHAFRHNAVRLQLHALAYNLANFLRSLALPQEVEQWSLTTLAREAGQDRRPDRAARALRGLPARRGRRAEGAVRRDPAPDRPAARITRAGDMTGGNQMMAAVEGRVMRWSPAEPAATSCRGAWKHLRSLLRVRIAASDTCLLTDVSRKGTVHCGDGGDLENPDLQSASGATIPERIMPDSETLCPFCRASMSGDAARCSKCGTAMPWDTQIRALHDEIKSRESSRLRATITLVEEAFDAFSKGKPISLSAIKGLLTAWFFPRAIIVLGSVIGGLILAVQTWIIWN